MHCSMLQYVAVCFRVCSLSYFLSPHQQCVAVCSSVLQSFAMCIIFSHPISSVWQYFAVHSSVLQCIAVCRSVLQCVAVCF